MTTRKKWAHVAAAENNVRGATTAEGIFGTRHDYAILGEEYCQQ